MDFEKLAYDLIAATKNHLCLEVSGKHEVWCRNQRACAIIMEAVKDEKVAARVFPNA